MKTIPRRVITGVKDGKSYIEADAIVSNTSEHYPGLIISDVWQTSQMPATLAIEKPIDNNAFPTVIKNGTYMRYVQIPTDKSLGIEAPAGQPHPLMHKTDSLDYIIILSGEVYLITETEETLLKAGDIVIQRATNHAWSNRSEQPCLQLAILIDAAVAG